MFGGQDVDEPILGVVCVLVLVHVYVFEARLEALAHVREEFHQRDGLHDEVVEVHRVVLVEAALVQIVDLRDVLGDVAFGLSQVVVGREEFVLGVAYLGLERAGVEAFRVFAEFDDAAFDQPDLIPAIVNSELSFVAEFLGVGAQYPGAEGVEGGDPHLARVRPNEQRDALLHLAGGLVGKRDRQYLVRSRKPLFQKIRDAVRQHSRLSATGPSKDKERPLGLFDRLQLRWI